MLAEESARPRAAGTALRRRSPVSKKREGPILSPSINDIVTPSRRNEEFATVYFVGSDSGCGSTNSSSTRESTSTSTSKPQQITVTKAIQKTTEDVRRGSRTPSGAHSEGRQTPSFWPCNQPVERRMQPGLSVRDFWEANIAWEEKERGESQRSKHMKPYSFPKWRSTDALSASLVASNSVGVPKDSVIPEKRLQKMRETNQEAAVQKALIHERAEPARPMRKGTSLDSLVIQVDYTPWYDREKIRSSVSRESIANIAEARERFEPNRNLTATRSRQYSGHSTRTTTSEYSSNNGLSHANDRNQHYQTSTNTNYITENGYSAHRRPSVSISTQKYNGSQGQAYSVEEQLFMLYMKQNPDIVSGLGIKFPQSTGRAMEELQSKRVELRFVDGTSPVHSESPRGRFLKKSQMAPASRRNDASVKEHDEGGEHHSDRLSPEKRIGSLIKNEMLQLKEREEELQKSRKALGLPSLEETMELWKQGNTDTLLYRMPAGYTRTNELPQLQRTFQSSELSSTNGSWD
ncbi:unnamed protein product [Cylicocyclus nassatus]|uniref:Uncharacterized protein n=1 Tax=Cylicocyclus nassatus TaxID=53992 RepID=A0AA36MC30_CYLNA|nr:unnamed protein product [Cylicocyclus nassatus]